MKKLLFLLITISTPGLVNADHVYLCNDRETIKIPLTKLTIATFDYTTADRLKGCVETNTPTPTSPPTDIVIVQCHTQWGKNGSIPCDAIIDKKQFLYYYASIGDAELFRIYDNTIAINLPSLEYGTNTGAILIVWPR